jgi:hypothetical protein
MTRASGRTLATHRTGELEALLGERELEEDARAVLVAYRDASEAARKAASPTTAPAADIGESVEHDAAATSAPRVQPGVPRLRSVVGVENERLAQLHGQLLALGYLTAEVLGRSDGLSYRITREGLRRLAGEADEAEAA